MGRVKLAIVNVRIPLTGPDGNRATRMRCINRVAWLAVAAAVATLALGAFGWHVWWNVSGRSRPWTEEPAHPSPDGRYVVYREGRSAFMELETRVTIATADSPIDAERDVLVPWSARWPVHVEWRGDHELVIEMSHKVASSATSSDHRTWRSVEVEIVRR